MERNQDLKDQIEKDQKEQQASMKKVLDEHAEEIKQINKLHQD